MRLKFRSWLPGLWLGVILIVLLLPSLEAARSSTGQKRYQQLIPVLIYHRVINKPTSSYDLTPEQLEAQLQFLTKQGFQTITAAQYLEFQKDPAGFPSKPVILSFDDGHLSHYMQVFPLLKKYGFTATFFVYPQVVSNASNTQITWDELKEMAAAGMDIESHTMTHPFLTKKRLEEDHQAYLKRLDHELRDSRLLIEEKLGRRVMLLAYPYGWFNTIVEERAVQAGYTGIFTVNWGNNLVNENPLRVKRRVMESGIDLAELESILTARPLKIEIFNPGDASIKGAAPTILFKQLDGNLEAIDLRIRSYKLTLTPDKKGYFLFGGLTDLSPGYHMIIIKGYDVYNHFYLGSWGFDYQPGLVND